MAVKANNAVVASTSEAPAKDTIVSCTLKSVDSDVQTNTNGTEYLKCTLVTSTGATARGVIYKSVWDKVDAGDTVNVALSTLADGSIVPSVIGLPLAKLTMSDFGL